MCVEVQDNFVELVFSFHLSRNRPQVAQPVQQVPLPVEPSL